MGALLRALAKGLVWLVGLPFKKYRAKVKPVKRSLLSSPAAKELAAYWAVVESKAQSVETRDLAIAEADKLLDAAFKQLGLTGETMSERLKAARALYPDALYERIWQAHKLRNRLAHEVGTVVTDHEIRYSLQTFQWALRELGVFI